MERLPHDIQEYIMTFVPNENKTAYDACIRVLQRRFHVLRSVISFATKNNLKMCDRLLDTKYDRLYSKLSSMKL